ncbi:peptidylprolyl isomerase [Candidatus Finniella inopinata]|uniref:Parvulin-like PPIase n=1 Tax=Candidatus Finniella inopinata TaxID=1696036 RepID=A0A4Q7DIT5_9PROT|nr:peptidylprolyl isomerase [Candidatus Finniella inopinata]RZI45914.1 hypothetical protein EQU50_05645 [Candidatus Finniella inopinata]
MLQSFREQSGKWFIKVLFGAIIASFVIWGIGDIIRGYGQNRPIAKVGNQSISYDRYATALQQEISRIQQIIKERVAPAQLQQLGVYQQVLDQLINQSVLEQELERSKLTVSDSLVRNQIHSIPTFQQNGTFNRQLFDELLRNNGLSEQAFLKDIKQSLLSQQLVAPLTVGMMLPTFYQDLLFKSLSENKVFTFVMVPFEKMKLTNNPTMEDFKLHFTQHQDQYAVPEFRSVTLVLVKTKSLLAQIPVSEDEIKQEYEAQAAQFTKPEQRSVKSLTYVTQDQVVEAAKLISKGQPLELVAKAVKGGRVEDLGVVEKANLPEIAADVVYSLEPNKASEMVDTGFGYTIYLVTKIIPETLQPLSEVKAQIQENLRLQKFGDSLTDLRNKIEDSLAGGEKLEDVAKANQLPIEAVPTFNQKGLSKDGKPVLASLPVPVIKQIVEQTFSLAEGAQSPVVEANQDYFFVVQVNKIDAPYAPEFEAVKHYVEKDLLLEKKNEAAAKLAQSMTQQVKSLSDLARLASQHGLSIITNQTLSRADFSSEKKDKLNDLQKNLSPDLLAKALQLPVNQATYGFLADNRGLAVVMLQRVEPFKVDQEKRKKFGGLLKDMVEKDIMALLMQNFRTHFKVSIDQDLMKRMTQDAG